MFEREVQRRRLSADDLPAEIRRRFAELRPLIARRSTIRWAEHCSECAAPSCFSTCEFYNPRTDFKCQRFARGIEAVPVDGAGVPDAMKISFRNWGKLEGIGPTPMHDLGAADQMEASDERAASLLNALPLPAGLSRAVIGRWFRPHYTPSHHTQTATKTPAYDRASRADALVLECYNPADAPVAATLTLRPVGEHSHQPYQRRWEIAPGFNRIVIARTEIAARIDLDTAFLTQIEPGDDEAQAPLYFGLLDFVTARGGLDALMAVATDKPIAAPVPDKPATLTKLKCIVWDLDNTLWAGTLVEDGPENLVLNEDFAQLIRDLDERGVLHSVASKNDADRALAVLRQFGLEDYFLHPQISWGPKSLALQTIAARLNIGIDTFLFVDDQPFERAEVGETNPTVTVVDPADLRAAIPDDILTKEPTAESRARRTMYKEEAVRGEAMEDFAGDYTAFLKGCALTLDIHPLGPDNLRRVHEMAQRTNQMNFSGNRYSQADLKAIMADETRATYVLRCSDRFGDYGIVGFGIFDLTLCRLQDLMFSCRIQSKRFEHAFIAHLLRTHTHETSPALTVWYRRTERNAPSARFFGDMGFELESQEGEVEILAYPKTLPIPDEGIVTITDHHSDTGSRHAALAASL